MRMRVQKEEEEGINGSPIPKKPLSLSLSRFCLLLSEKKKNGGKNWCKSVGEETVDEANVVCGRESRCRPRSPPPPPSPALQLLMLVLMEHWGRGEKSGVSKKFEVGKKSQVPSVFRVVVVVVVKVENRVSSCAPSPQFRAPRSYQKRGKRQKKRGGGGGGE